MQLPFELRAAIEREATGIEESVLRTTAEIISATYRSGVGRSHFSAVEALAYALVRFPATYAAAVSVLLETANEHPGQVRSLLGLGSGLGAAAWAAVSVWASLEKITLIERESALLNLGKRLVSTSAPRALQEAYWICADVARGTALVRHDAVILSYSLGELDSTLLPNLVESAWEAAREVLILIEAGTPRRFALIRAVRARLIELGANIAAPCPHQRDCPMPENDWCHFAARVERTAMHRRLKNAKVNYEDEKFSYVVATKTPARPVTARIVRRPKKHPGLIELTLCTMEGLSEREVRKRDDDFWGTARKARWGDGWAL